MTMIPSYGACSTHPAYPSPTRVSIESYPCFWNVAIALRANGSTISMVNTCGVMSESTAA